jgi:hypothetical protein
MRHDPHRAYAIYDWGHFSLHGDPAMWGGLQAAFPPSCYHNCLLVSLCHAMGLTDIVSK